MSKGGNRNYDNEEKDGQTAKLKKRIHHLEKENTKLKSDCRTYEKALSKNIVFLKEKTDSLSLEDLINGVNADLNLQQIKATKVDSFEEMKKKWCCFECNIGIMKFISFPKAGDNYYFRKCSNPRCNHRTEAKILTEEVDKGI
jgi:hypothetical protein